MILFLINSMSFLSRLHPNIVYTARIPLKSTSVAQPLRSQGSSDIMLENRFTNILRYERKLWGSEYEYGNTCDTTDCALLWAFIIGGILLCVAAASCYRYVRRRGLFYCCTMYRGSSNFDPSRPKSSYMDEERPVSVAVSGEVAMPTVTATAVAVASPGLPVANATAVSY